MSSSAPAPASAVPLTEDQIDDLIYFARADDLQELRGTLAELSAAYSVSQSDVLSAAVDGSSGNTPVHMAAANGHEDVLRFLISLLPSISSMSNSSKGQDSSSNGPSKAPTDSDSASASTSNTSASTTTPFIDRPNASGNTALHWAAVNGRTGAVRLLVDAGADLTKENTARHDALDEAERAGRADVVRVLLARMTGKTEAEVIAEGEAPDGVEGDVEGEAGANGDSNAHTNGVKATQEQLEKLGLESG